MNFDVQVDVLMPRRSDDPATNSEPSPWIPPEFREFVYAELDDNDLDGIRQTYKVSDGKGNFIPQSDEEIKGKIKRLTGVIDTRTGKYYPNQYFRS